MYQERGWELRLVANALKEGCGGVRRVLQPALNYQVGSYLRARPEYLGFEDLEGTGI